MNTTITLNEAQQEMVKAACEHFLFEMKAGHYQLQVDKRTKVKALKDTLRALEFAKV